MTRPDRKYVRVYCDDLAAEYPEVWEDANLGWTWLRLLDVAEKMWPAIPEVPRWVKPRILARLVEVGLVTLVSPHRFRLKGVDKQRAERAAHAKKGADGRWGNAPGTPTGNAPSSPVGNAGSESLDETPRDTTSSDERADENDPFAEPEYEARIWLSKHGCHIGAGNGWHQKLVLAVERHGSNAVVGMLDRLAGAGMPNGDIKGFLFGMIDALDAKKRPNLHALEREDRAEERATARRNRRPSGLQAEIAAAIEARERAS